MAFRKNSGCSCKEWRFARTGLFLQGMAFRTNSGNPAETLFQLEKNQ